MMKRILVGLGGTPSTDAAVRQAIDVAQRHRAELTGMAVSDLKRLANVGPVSIGGDAYARRLREHRRVVTKERIEEAIGKFESACKTAGLSWQVRREMGDPFKLMVSQARYHDVTVFGLNDLFDYGVVKEPRDLLSWLVDAGPQPMLAVAAEARAVQRVLIAYDGSIASAGAMKQFIQLNLWPNASIRIVCFSKKVEDAQQLLNDATAYCRLHGHETDAQRLSGEAQQQLLQHATEWEADLIVMGQRARRRLTRRLFGDATTQVMRHADQSVFLAR